MIHDTGFLEARLNMVRCQLAPNHITDAKLLEAMYNTPRHIFVHEKFKDVAYIDGQLQVDEKRFMLEPLILARMLQACKINEECEVLDIGCGLGYSSVILASLAKHVIGIENDMALTIRAKYICYSLGIKNCIFHTVDLSTGYPDSAPFDIIFINGAMLNITSSILMQLKKGGRIVFIEPVNGIMNAVCCTEVDGSIVREVICHASANFLY